MIQLQNITKRFSGFTALRSVSLEVRVGELTALLGPSGCGKTTLLRIIAGLEAPDTGAVLFGGEDITYSPPRHRKIGFVFQHFALFPHMTVFENIAFGLRVREPRNRPSKADISERVMHLLKLIQLEWLAESYPGNLSGGQRQRVALARALAVEPKVLLLDEPFSSLDATVRRELRRWLRRLHDELHITSILVTHDQEEALEVSDRVVVMNQGRLEQEGTPESVYDHPVNQFVYHFLGNVNIFKGRLHDGTFKINEAQNSVTQLAAAERQDAVGCVRPYEIEVSKERESAGSIPAMLLAIKNAGPLFRLELERSDGQGLVEVELQRLHFQKLGIKRGDTVFLNLLNMKVFLDQGANI